MKNLDRTTKLLSIGILLFALIFWISVNQTRKSKERELALHALTVQVLQNVDISYPSPYDPLKMTEFRLQNGSNAYTDALRRPVSYRIATTTFGDMDGDGIAEGAIALYQSYGANRITPLLLLFGNDRGRAVQLDALVLDTSDWKDLTAVQSIEIKNGVLIAHLLVLSDKDKRLPHYRQKPTVEKTVSYSLQKTLMEVK